MLAYAQGRAEAANASARFELADMVDFELDAGVQFAYVMLGSLAARNTALWMANRKSAGRPLSCASCEVFMSIFEWQSHQLRHKRELR
jgi:hypothetical protein